MSIARDGRQGVSVGLAGQRGLCCCARVPRVRCGGLQRVSVFEWGIGLGFLKGSLWSLTRLIPLSCSDIDLALIYEKQQKAVALCPKEHRSVSSRRHVETLYSTGSTRSCQYKVKLVLPTEGQNSTESYQTYFILFTFFGRLLLSSAPKEDFMAYSRLRLRTTGCAVTGIKSLLGNNGRGGRKTGRMLQFTVMNVFKHQQYSVQCVRAQVNSQEIHVLPIYWYYAVQYKSYPRQFLRAHFPYL